MAQESGGNPFAINLTDINARMGDPSRGLMQTIMSTFMAYRSFSLPNDIYNPIANIFAGLNYAVNSPNYRGRPLSSVMLQAGGYDHGGYLPTGLSLAYNGTGRPEPVGHGGGGTYYVTVNMPFGSTRAEVENGLVKALDSLNRQRRIPK
jgi:SLT domain-containing protein